MSSFDRYLGRLISALECGVEAAERDIITKWQDFELAHVVGLTGPPGVGKSVLLGQLAGYVHQLGTRVGVLAVDPSSQISNGAVLADRFRMLANAAGDGLFIRSLASRGTPGGLARVIPAAVRALECAGYQVIFIETVGVGQNETEIRGIGDTVVVVQAPGWGDEVQGLKAGVLEIADIFVCNKCDLNGAEEAKNVLKGVAHAGPSGGWRPPVIMTAALASEGITELWAAVERHRNWLSNHSSQEERRHRRVAVEVLGRAKAELAQRLESSALAEEVSRGRMTPSEAVCALLQAVES